MFGNMVDTALVPKYLCYTHAYLRLMNKTGYFNFSTLDLKSFLLLSSQHLLQIFVLQLLSNWLNITKLILLISLVFFCGYALSSYTSNLLYLV